MIELKANCGGKRKKMPKCGYERAKLIKATAGG